MNDSHDQQLLEAYSETNSEQAFHELLQRNLATVHAIARRVTLNDDLARDISQQVFLRLSAQAKIGMPEGVSLSCWLNRTTRSLAINLVQSEERRRNREHTAYKLQGEEESRDFPAETNDLDALVEEMLGALPAPDRELVSMRFFLKMSHVEIGAARGMKEDTARKRVQRILEQLKSMFEARGVRTSEAMLSALIPVHIARSTALHFSTPKAVASIAAQTSAANLNPLSTLFLTIMNTKIIVGSAVAALLLLTFLLWENSSRTPSTAAGSVARNEAAIGTDAPRGSSSTSGRPSRTGIDRRTVEVIPVVAKAKAMSRPAAYDDEARIKEISNLFDDLTPSQFNEALTSCSEITPHGAQEQMLTALLMAWVRKDPRTGIAHAAEIYLAKQPDDILTRTFAMPFKEWCASNPADAYLWLADQHHQFNEDFSSTGGSGHATSALAGMADRRDYASLGRILISDGPVAGYFKFDPDDDGRANALKSLMKDSHLTDERTLAGIIASAAPADLEQVTAAVGRIRASLKAPEDPPVEGLFEIRANPNQN